MARAKALWTRLPNYVGSTNCKPVAPVEPEPEGAHSKLVRLAAQWLFRTKRCSVVITEMCGGSTEIPDAIGWKGHGSILVECKTSRSDFKADQQKISRRHTPHGIGCYRYYFCEWNTITVQDLPEKWGLISLQDGRVRLMREAVYFDDVNHSYEKSMLVSCLRRLGQSAPAGVSISCYTMETKRRATLGVRKDEQ
jgi:hypothetical protein